MIALIDYNSAAKGYEFLYLGRAEECSDCELRTPCHHNLEKGRRYRVISLREKDHPCKLFEKVRICEVNEIGLDAAIDQDSVFLGASIKYSPIKCKNVLCSSISHCHPEGLNQNERCLIIDVKNKIICPERDNLVRVTLKRL